MLSLLLVLCFPSQTIWLKDGRKVECDYYQTGGDQVLARRDMHFFSYAKSQVDWPRTRRQARLDDKEATRFRPVGAPNEDSSDHGNAVLQQLDVRRVSLIDLLRFLADQVGFNLYIEGSVEDERVTYMFKNIRVSVALDIILRNAGLHAQWQHQTMSVNPLLR